jgi:hypothetical protein
MIPGLELPANCPNYCSQRHSCTYVKMCKPNIVPGNVRQQTPVGFFCIRCSCDPVWCTSNPHAHRPPEIVIDDILYRLGLLSTHENSVMFWLRSPSTLKRSKPQNYAGTQSIDQYFGGFCVHSTKNPVQAKLIFAHNGRFRLIANKRKTVYRICLSHT